MPFFPSLFLFPSKSTPGFLWWDQHMRALLILILLWIAGIERNPGPSNDPSSTGPWYCSVCSLQIHGYHTSVSCKSCHAYCHVRKKNNCSGLSSTKEWSNSFICPACRPAQPTTIRNAPIPSLLGLPFTPPTSIMPVQNRNNPGLHSLLAPFQPPTPGNTPLCVLQLNCNGFANKCEQIIQFLQENDIAIAALQETKLPTGPSSLQPKTGHFTLIRKDRAKNKGGGLAFLIRNTIEFEDLPTKIRTISPRFNEYASGLRLNNG